MKPSAEDLGTLRESVSPQDLPPVPDQDGPHDVPDEAVIEATLPTVPVSGLD